MYEAKYPHVKKGGDKQTSEAKKLSAESAVSSFAKDTAAKTKQSARTKAEDGDAIEPTFREWDGTGSLNLHRRHLNESQRGMVAAKMARMDDGGSRRGDQFANLRTENVSQAEAAVMLKVSPRSVSTAKKILKTASSETIAAVESGQLPVSVATRAQSP